MNTDRISFSVTKTTPTQKHFELIGFFLGWISVIAQFILIIQNRQEEMVETIIRFFSFFTILTNILVALFYTAKVFKPAGDYLKIFRLNGAVAAITTYILIVGLVYQFFLRGIWEPKGAQMVVDEILHTIVPLYFLTYWYFFSTGKNIKFGEVILWLLYPVFYLGFALSRGLMSGFYPYPFINISEIGITQVLINSALIVVLILVVLGLLVYINNKKSQNN